MVIKPQRDSKDLFQINLLCKGLAYRFGVMVESDFIVSGGLDASISCLHQSNGGLEIAWRRQSHVLVDALNDKKSGYKDTTFARKSCASEPVISTSINSPSFIVFALSM